MSRCFPFPPPGYVKNGIRDEALIESIKLKREEEKAKKERKKEKKDKKREKKEIDKARNSGETESKKHGHKKRHKDERSQEGKKGGDCQKRRQNEVECFEKSTLTEEHGQAVRPQNSSDSTLNSSKKQKLSSPPSDSGHNSGSIIRIRLPSQRHIDPVVLPCNEQACSTSGKIDEAFVQGTHEHVPRSGRELGKNPCSTSSIRLPELTPKLSKGKPCSSSGASECRTYNAPASLPSNLCCSCSPTLTSQFKILVEDWVVPTLQTELTSFGENWLFQKKQNLNSGIKSSKEGNVGAFQMNSTSWPHACFLTEADIYALPFTVPF